jgi:ferrochelatase
MDKNIINLPPLLRRFAALWISWSRGRGAAKEAYHQLGGKSPLLENTRAQAQELEKALREDNPSARVFVSMRYWHPLAEEVVREVAAFRPDKIVLLPLYPQYSTTTSFSAFEDWKQAAAKAGLKIPTVTVCCYPEDAGFITASAGLIRAALKGAPGKTRLLFSAHGLPEKIIRSGDPYQHQCEQTAAAIVKQLNMPQLDWQLCYQSRVGPLKWIGPPILEALEKAAEDKTGVVVYPLAFVSEHVETLVELDIDYRRRAAALGIPHFFRVRTVCTHPAFIDGLRKLVLAAAHGIECAPTCPENSGRCYYHGEKKND